MGVQVNPRRADQKGHRHCPSLIVQNLTRVPLILKSLTAPIHFIPFMSALRVVHPLGRFGFR